MNCMYKVNFEIAVLIVASYDLMLGRDFLKKLEFNLILKTIPWNGRLLYAPCNPPRPLWWAEECPLQHKKCVRCFLLKLSISRTKMKMMNRLQALQI
jgi:hypothetical protein